MEILRKQLWIISHRRSEAENCHRKHFDWIFESSYKSIGYWDHFWVIGMSLKIIISKPPNQTSKVIGHQKNNCSQWQQNEYFNQGKKTGDTNALATAEKRE